MLVAGTCEELISWDAIGGVQPLASKRFLSTQGHSFRVRSPGGGRMLMQHTLNDLVIRGCEDEAEKARDKDLAQLEIETAELLRERDQLRETLAGELSRLLVAIKQASSNSSNTTATWSAPASVSVSPRDGAVREMYKGAASPLLGALFSSKLH